MSSTVSGVINYLMEITKTIQLGDLEKAIQAAGENDKSVLFFDETGTAASFFTYTAKVVECAKMQVQKAMGGTSVDEIKEKYRVNNKNAMATGCPVVYHIDKIVPDFKGEYCDDTTTPACFFKPSAFKVEEVFKKTLKEDEDKDAFGNKGGFEIRDGYSVVLLSQANPEDEEIVQ